MLGPAAQGSRILSSRELFARGQGAPLLLVQDDHRLSDTLGDIDAEFRRFLESLA